MMSKARAIEERGRTERRGLEKTSAKEEKKDVVVVAGQIKLTTLATLLERAVVRDLADELALDECSVDYDQDEFEECTNKVTEQLAEVVVLCTSADVASKYSVNLRNKELSRLRAALWNLRVILESYCATKGGCSLNVRHRFETLRSAAMDVLHPRKRLKKGPSGTAIPNLQAVMVPMCDCNVAVTDSVDDDNNKNNVDIDNRVSQREVAFYRGGQPSVEGRAWLAKNGFTKVVDLRGEDRDNQWVKPFGGGEGQGSFNQNKKFETMSIPIRDMDVPKMEQVKEFIKIANDVLEKNKTKKPGEPKEKLLLHCKAGIGRTGCLVACWRISRGVDLEEALGMESGLVCDFGSISQEQFVRDFAAELKHEEERKKFEKAVENSKFETSPKLRAGYDPVNEYGSMGDVTDASSMGSAMGSVAASGEFSSLDQAPDMYLIRTDGFSCTREMVENRELKIAHPSTQQMILVWREPPKTIFLLKKIGNALLPQLVEVAHALMTMGMNVVLDTDVKRELEDASIKFETVDEKNRTEVRTKALWIDKDSKGKIPKGDFGAIDVCVCLGGDGVILHASKMFQGPMPPVLGFHLGSLGFLTNHPGDDMAPSLLMALGRGPPVANISGGVPITLRMRLICEVFKYADKIENGGSGKSSFVYTILNEVLVDRGPSPFLSKIDAYDRGQLITSIQADGVMLATATGSTAYSVSAGGSMVHPNVQAILMTPICPHTLSFRPVIFPDSVEVELRVSENARNSAWVSFDGRERCELCRGDSVFVKMSEYPVPTINFENQTGDFISSLRRCLKWNEREEQQVFDASQVAALRTMNEQAAQK